MWVASPTTTAHPGSHSYRAVARATDSVDNPNVQLEDFERRFIATPERLANNGKNFDFIVVGAGSAGCALASRLAAAPSRPSVLLVEAGGEAHNAPPVRSPNHIFHLWRSEVDWGFRSMPNPHLGGRVLDLERGKTLGGSSAINYMMWVRGHKTDYDIWESEHGCKGWSYKDVLPNFNSLEKICTHHNDGAEVDKGLRGVHGGIQTQTVYPLPDEVQAFLTGCNELGIPNTPDYNGAQQEGARPTEFNIFPSGGRGDAFTALVSPLLRSQKNLTVCSEGFVRKLIMTGSQESGDLRCTGVEVEVCLRSPSNPTGAESVIVPVYANKEVILSAGAFQSPQILMLSGIGDKKILTKGMSENEIKAYWKRDLPGVGKNLQDHPMIPLTFKIKDPTIEYRVNNSCGLTGQCFLKSDIEKKDEVKFGYPTGTDLQVILITRLNPEITKKILVYKFDRLPLIGPYLRDSSLLRPLQRKIYKLASYLPSTAFGREAARKSLSVAVVLNRAKSIGHLTLASLNPHDPPKIHLNLCKDPADLARLVWGLKQATAILRKSFNNIEQFDDLPELLSRDPTDEEWVDFIKKYVATVWHYSGTTKMGDPSNPNTVVDPRCRVVGVVGLRVADAGCMPLIPSGNTNAPSMMIGDRCGELIIEDHFGKQAAKESTPGYKAKL